MVWEIFEASKGGSWGRVGGNSGGREEEDEPISVEYGHNKWNTYVDTGSSRGWVEPDT